MLVSTPVRLVRALAAVGVMVGLVLTPTAAHASTVASSPSVVAARTDDPAATLITLTNDARASVGANALVGASGVQAVAQAWAQRLADADVLQHNPEASAQLPDGWSSWGENVASGGGLSPEAMNDMWTASPPHLENMVNPDFTVMGVGYAVSAGGTVYGVELFAAYADPAQAGGEPAAPVEGLAPLEVESAPEEPADDAASEAPAAPAEAAPAIEPAPAPVDEVVPAADATAGADGGGSSAASAGPHPLIIALSAGAAVFAAVSAVAFAAVARSRRKGNAAAPQGDGVS